MSAWVNVKEAAALAGVSARVFREEWVPEEALPQVTWRSSNGKTGRARRIEVDLDDLQAVLASRVFSRPVEARSR